MTPPPPEAWEALRLSLKVASVATVVSLPFAVLVAWALVRWRFPGKGLLNGIVHLPLILPPVVIGYLLLIVFGTRSGLGAWLADIGIVFAFRWTGAALAAGIMAFPLMMRAIKLSLEAVDPKLEAASATLGASPWQVFRTVTLPLILPGILAGGILAFAKAMGEFGATITFVANIPGETRTMPTAIYTALQVPGAEGQVVWLVLISLTVSLLALGLAEWVSRRLAARIGAGHA